MGWGRGRVVCSRCDGVGVGCAGAWAPWGFLSATSWRAAHTRMHACGRCRVRSVGCLVPAPCCARDGWCATARPAPLSIVHACPCGHVPVLLPALWSCCVPRACARVSRVAPRRLRPCFVHAAVMRFGALRPRGCCSRMASHGAGRRAPSVGSGLCRRLPQCGLREEHGDGRARVCRGCAASLAPVPCGHGGWLLLCAAAARLVLDLRVTSVGRRRRFAA